MIPRFSLALLLFLSNTPIAPAFRLPLFSSTVTNTKPSTEEEPISYPLPKKVAVAGATGRTGSLVVEELRRRNVEVVALVRDLEKANNLFSDEAVSIVKCNLASESEIEKGEFFIVVKFSVFNHLKL